MYFRAYLAMEIRSSHSVFDGTIVEDLHPRFCGLSLRGVRHGGGEQVRVHHHSQGMKDVKQKFKEMVGNLFDGMTKEVGLED